jgi:hypothetical protein
MDKSVKGIHVKNQHDPEQLKTLLCNRGVVVASGGFSADVAFRAIENSSFDEHVMSTNQPGAPAEVLKESLKIGASSAHISCIQLGLWTSPDETGFGEAPFFCLRASLPYSIFVEPKAYMCL